MTIDTNDATFTFKRNVRKQLNGTRVVVTALLAQKALVLLGAETTEALQPRELEALTGIRGGTLRPILKKLSDDGIVSRKADGYVLPNAALEDIEDLLNE